jgi:hypothetical protein
MTTSGTDLLSGSRPDRALPSVLENGLTEGGDFLREAQLTDVRFDALSSTLCLVLDLRNALEFPEADIAVAVLRGVREFSWLGTGSAQEYQAWYVMDSRWDRKGYWCEAAVSLLPGQDLKVQSRSLEIAVGRSGLYEVAPPDLGSDSRAEIEAGFPNADTPFVVERYFELAAERP